MPSWRRSRRARVGRPASAHTGGQRRVDSLAAECGAQARLDSLRAQVGGGRAGARPPSGIPRQSTSWRRCAPPRGRGWHRHSQNAQRPPRLRSSWTGAASRNSTRSAPPATCERRHTRVCNGTTSTRGVRGGSIATRSLLEYQDLRELRERNVSIEEGMRTDRLPGHIRSTSEISPTVRRADRWHCTRSPRRVPLALRAYLGGDGLRNRHLAVPPFGGWACMS